MNTAPLRRRDRPRLPAAQRRRQILDVTTRLIAERGFWGLSMQDVADGCGLTVPGLLHHVGSKDALLIAVLEHRDEEDHRSLAVQLGMPRAEMAGRVPLPEICAAVVRRNAGQPEIVRLFAVLEAESLAPDHPAHDYFRARQDRTIAEFSELARGLVAEPETLAGQVMALMDGLQIQWLRDPARFDLVTAWTAAARVLFAAAPPPGPAASRVTAPELGS
ncbi:TetR/AcrR family transcriptional regulator [Actinoplanes teichomyceticus]|uniref:TetR family transcriptional regulator n=1 Tax=Actinoplanes teichomyceticus TaxID=1867 RepID=A0A561WJN8_ACTTI|nr:TetR/AcrR family transcriptional regulator [Actinoplanes teichomyceticus]TWG24084.1 TetR family transcriptional regulator [Actinoplanes teichomyceticus]GIF12124.1 TetR family transcriptional regulator [Actinoplanes teichomyceticus]